ncbi:MAG: hypothetical protein ACXQTP_04790 [Candidatus Methanofastidiosia archaeon]
MYITGAAVVGAAVVGAAVVVSSPPPPMHADKDTAIIVTINANAPIFFKLLFILLPPCSIQSRNACEIEFAFILCSTDI